MSSLEKKLAGLNSNVDIIKHIVYYLGPVTMQDIARKMSEVMLSFQPDRKSIEQFIKPILSKCDYYTKDGQKWDIIVEKVPEHAALPQVMQEEQRLLYERELRSRLAIALGSKVKSVCIELERDPNLKKFDGKWGLKRWELVNDSAYELMKKRDKPLTAKEVLTMLAEDKGEDIENIVFDPRGDRRFVQERKAWWPRELAEKAKSDRTAAASVKVRQEPVELELEGSFKQAQSSNKKSGRASRRKGKVKLRKMMQQEAKQALKDREALVTPVEVDLAAELSQEQEFDSDLVATSYNQVESSMKERSLSAKERENITAFVNQLVEMGDVSVGAGVNQVLREPLSLHKIVSLLKLKYLPYITDRVIIPDDYYRFAGELVAPHPGVSVLNPAAQAGAFATQMLNVTFERLEGAAWAPYGTHIEVVQRDGVRYKIHVQGTPLHKKSQEDFLISQNDLVDYFILNNLAVLESDKLLARSAQYNMRLSGFPNVYVTAKDFLSQLPEVFSERANENNEVSVRFDLVFSNLTFIKEHNLAANYIDQILRLLDLEGVACLFVLRDLLQLLRDHDFMEDVIGGFDFRYVFHCPQIDTRNPVSMLVIKHKDPTADAAASSLVTATVKDVKDLSNILVDLARGVRQSAFYEVLKQESVRRILAAR
jgi:hypothetical protein